jgi:Holliday junction resolvase RusA-like endonuclease
MKPIIFETFIEMTPVPNKSPKVTRFGAYKPKECVHASNLIADRARSVTGSLPPCRNAVGLWLTFIMPRPKSRKKDEFHVTRPDASNLYYLAENALKGIVYDDDSQVVISLSMKRYQMAGEPCGVKIIAVDMGRPDAYFDVLEDKASLCVR